MGVCLKAQSRGQQLDEMNSWRHLVIVESFLKDTEFTGAQQMNNQSQNQPAASLAAALAPFLQQNGGIQNLQGLLAGQLQPNAAPQNNLNPAAQLNPMDQVRIQPFFILILALFKMFLWKDGHIQTVYILSISVSKPYYEMY